MKNNVNEQLLNFKNLQKYLFNRFQGRFFIFLKRNQEKSCTFLNKSNKKYSTYEFNIVGIKRTETGSFWKQTVMGH